MNKEQIDEILDEVIDKILPLCICGEGSVKVEESCPNELLDGCWSDTLNRHIKEELRNRISKEKT